MRRNFFVLIVMIIWIATTIRNFFWWDSTAKNNKLLQNKNIWFIEELANTWNIDTWNTILPDDYKEFAGIRIMMPRYFYNSGWDSFVKNIYNSKQIQIQFTLIDDLNSYRDLLYDKNFSESDLFLFPYDRKKKLITRNFTFQENLNTYFDKSLSSIFTENQTTFIPFSADPMIMYTISWYSYQNNFYSISEYISNRKSIKPLSFPLFFGIEPEDYDKKWFEREYQDIVRYALMHYFTTNHDSHNLQRRIDSNLQNSEKYNIENINTIINAITNPQCKHFPSICLQIYNFVWIRFWFLSDIDIVNEYFSWKIENFKNLSKLKLPFSQQESPVRIRWRWISNSLKNPGIESWINEFIKKHIYEHNQYNLRNSTIPVFKTEKWNWIADNQYIWTAWYILQEWWDYINTLRGVNNFWDLIKYNITALDYLK